MKNSFGLFRAQLNEHLELQKIPSNVQGLVLILFILSFFVIALFVSSVFSKLGENTKYTVLTSSEYFYYQPISNNASDILFKNYALDKGCTDVYGEVHTEDAVLDLSKGSQISITRYADSFTHLAIVAAEGFSSVGELDYETLPDCVQIKVMLDHSYPVFSMNLIGEVRLGQELTDASDGYFPLLIDGEIGITDISVLTRSPYQLIPYELTKGNYVYFENTMSPVKGLLRATYNQSAIDGVFSFQGGSAYVQKYRTHPEKVEVSVFNRISSDSELAILLSTLIIAMQFFAFLISFLLKLKFIEDKTEPGND